jgi:ubiquinone/menaquinone biosynthesis C-methylase UbiE
MMTATAEIGETVQQTGLALEACRCAICGIDDAEPVGVGEDFEYRTCPDTFLAVRCLQCGLVFLNPRPAEEAMPRIYPDNYHAFDFTPESFGLVLRVRRKLESRRLLKFAKGIPADAKIIDIGCGDGFHLKLLRDSGPKTWSLEGVDTDARAVKAATSDGLTIHHGPLEDLQLPENRYHLALMIMTVEHLNDPVRTLREATRILAPGGRLVIVTDNTGSPDFWLFQGRHWGGYHFPRHTYLFNTATLAKLAENVGLKPRSIRTALSPVNWVYSCRNWVDDWGGPRWLVRFLSLKSPLALAVGTLWDLGWKILGRGAILQATFEKPTTSEVGGAS